MRSARLAVLPFLFVVGCDDAPAVRQDRGGVDLTLADGARAEGAAGDLGRTESSAAADASTCASDKLAAFEGGPAYYSKFAAFPGKAASFFPIAVWLQSPSNAAKYKAIGINTFVGLWEGPTASQLTELKTAGVPTICDQNATGLASLADPTIIGWTQGDEPDNAQADGSGGYGPCIEPSVIQAKYAAMKAKDATRPVYLNLGRGVSDVDWVGRGVCTSKTEMYPEYAKGADILSFDIYPVNSDQGKLWYTAQGVDNLRKWAGYAKPVWNWIECTAYDGGTAPTPAQVKAEVWMSLVHGSLGIGYFAHVFKPSFVEAGLLADAAMSQAVKGINQQITALASVLNTPSVSNGVVVKSSDTQIPVDTMLKRHGGATYLFAVAMRSGTTTASFTLTCVPPTASVEVIGEGRTLTLKSSAFEDTFSSFAVHLYKIGP